MCLQDMGHKIFYTPPMAASFLLELAASVTAAVVPMRAGLLPLIPSSVYMDVLLKYGLLGSAFFALVRAGDDGGYEAIHNRHISNARLVYNVYDGTICKWPYRSMDQMAFLWVFFALTLASFYIADGEEPRFSLA